MDSKAVLRHHKFRGDKPQQEEIARHTVAKSSCVIVIISASVKPERTTSWFKRVAIFPSEVVTTRTSARPHLQAKPLYVWGEEIARIILKTSRRNDINTSDTTTSTSKFMIFKRGVHDAYEAGEYRDTGSPNDTTSPSSSTTY
jgi:hypothetical protein